MVEIYMKRGMSKEDATLVIETMAKYKDFFVDTMMQQELELQVSGGAGEYTVLSVTISILNGTWESMVPGPRRRSRPRESA